MSSLPDNLKLIGDVTVTLSVELGRTQMALKDVMALSEESVVVLNRMTDELLDVCVNGKAIAKAEVIAQDNRFALRIVEVADGGGEPIGNATQAQPAEQQIAPDVTETAKSQAST